MDELALIIFSKNRPLQLEFLLTTLKTYCSDNDSITIHILFKATTDRFKQAYIKLIRENPRIKFHEESNFRKQLEFLLSNSRYTAFMVDDNVCFRTFSFLKCSNMLGQNAKAIGFSLRLGQDFVGYRTPDEKLGETSGVVHWMSKSGDYWDYPMEVSSSIYRTHLIKIMLMQDKENFVLNPNRLEGFLNSQRQAHQKEFPYLLYPEKAVCICIPLNTVQGGKNCDYSDNGPSYDADTLLVRFENSKQLRLPRIPDIHNGHYIPSLSEMKNHPM